MMTADSRQETAATGATESQAPCARIPTPSEFFSSLPLREFRVQEEALVAYCLVEMEKQWRPGMMSVWVEFDISWTEEVVAQVCQRFRARGWRVNVEIRRCDVWALQLRTGEAAGDGKVSARGIMTWHE